MNKFKPSDIVDSAKDFLYWAARSKEDDVSNFIFSIFEPRVYHTFIVQESPHWELDIDNCKLLEEYGRQKNLTIDYVELTDDEEGNDQTMYYCSTLLSGILGHFFGATGSGVNINDAKNAAAQHALEFIKIFDKNDMVLSMKFGAKKLENKNQ